MDTHGRSTDPDLRVGWGGWAVLLGAALVRLAHLGSPPLGMHSWRQSDTAAIARNFAREGMNIALPRIDWRGAGPGFVQTELPVYPWTVAWLYRAFGEWDGWARLTSACASVLGVWFVIKLAALTDNRRTGVVAGAVVAFAPLSIYYGRAIMPESWMLCGSVASLYCFARWSVGGRDWWLVGGTMWLALACLCKIPALCLGLPVAFLLWLRLRGRLLADWRVWCCAACVLVPVVVWYSHAFLLYKISGLSFGIGEHDKWLTSTTFSLDFWWGMATRRMASRILTWPLAIVCVLAMLRVRRTTSLQRLYDVWLVALVVYLAIVAEGNRRHEYYQLPLLLPCACFVARGIVLALTSDPWRIHAVTPWRGVLSRVDGSQRSRTAIVLAFVLAAGVLSTLRVASYWREEQPAQSQEWRVAQRLKHATRTHDLVVSVNPFQIDNPTLLYAADRKGWTSGLGTVARPDDWATRFPRAVAIAGARTNFRSSRAREVFEGLARDPRNQCDPEDGFVILLSPSAQQDAQHTP